MKLFDERMWTHRVVANSSFFIFRKIYRCSAPESVATNQKPSLSCAVGQSFEKIFGLTKSSKSPSLRFSPLRAWMSALLNVCVVTRDMSRPLYNETKKDVVLSTRLLIAVNAKKMFVGLLLQ